MQKLKFVGLFLLLMPLLLLAQQPDKLPDPLPNTYINDLAGVLKPDQLRTLNVSIDSLEKKSSVQLAVVIIDHLPDGMAIEDYARGIGRKWHVGKNNNGLVYVAAIGDKKQRLEVASNLEGDIPDYDAKAITEKLRPFFRAKDYYGWINSLILQINDKVNPVIKEQKAAYELKRNKEFNDGLYSLLWILFYIALCAGAGFFIYLYVNSVKEKEKEKKRLAEIREREARDKMLAAIQRDRRESINYKPKNKYDDYRIPPLPIHTKPKHKPSKLSVTPDKKPLSTKPTSNDESSSYISPAAVIIASTYSRNDDDDNSSSSSSSSSSDYGNWGSGSSPSSDSGFTGGGSSNNL